MNDTSAKKTLKPALVVVILLGVYLLVTSAFFPLKFLSPYDAKRVLQLVLFTSIMMLAVSWGPLRQHTVTQLCRLSTFQRTCLGLFFAIGIASSLRLTHPAYALADVSLLFIMCVLVAVTAASRNLSGVKFDQWAVVLLAVMGFFVALQEFMGILAGWAQGIEFSFNLALMHFGHPRFYNQVQTWTIPALAALPLLFPDKKWLRSGCVALLGLQWFLVIMVGARGTFISLALAMTFIAFWLPAQRKYWLKYQLTGLFLGVLIYLGILFMTSIMIPGSKSGDFYAQSAGRSMVHTSGRSNFWLMSLQDVSSHPILGAGPTQFACSSEDYYPAHPHSFLFRILGEWGPLALLLIVFLTFTIGRKYLSGLKHSSYVSDSDPPIKAMLAISLIGGVIHSGLSGLMTMPASQVGLVLLAGWALSLSSGTQSRATPSVPSPISHVPIFAGVLLTCTILIFAAMETTQFRVRMGYVALDGRMVPRFWQDGRVCKYSYDRNISSQ